MLLENFGAYSIEKGVRFSPTGSYCLEWDLKLQMTTCVSREEDQKGEETNMSPALTSDGVWFPTLPKEK